jgi:peroxiredoxin
MKLATVVAIALVAIGCNSPSASPTGAAPPAASSPGAAAAAERAEIGKPAPDFTLTDYEGKTHHLADYKGKTVVLEWFNPDCPFVKASHGKGSLKTMAKRLGDKVVWLGINSSAPGKQGNGRDRVEAGKKAFDLSHAVLIDDSGRVGKQYGATNTPHMYVIGPDGVLAYRGAIDNSPDGEGESPTGGKLINYVDAALDDLAAKRPVAMPETRAYGCGVKYGSLGVLRGT